jgi:hypothetical protein
MPSPPIVMASDTPIVLNCQASMSCLITAALTTFPKSCTGEKLCQLGSKLNWDAHPHNACWVAVSLLNELSRGCGLDSLARVSLPPYCGDTDMRGSLHHLSIRHAGRVEHSLCSIRNWQARRQLLPEDAG